MIHEPTLVGLLNLLDPRLQWHYHLFMILRRNLKVDETVYHLTIWRVRYWNVEIVVRHTDSRTDAHFSFCPLVTTFRVKLHLVDTASRIRPCLLYRWIFNTRGSLRHRTGWSILFSNWDNVIENYPAVVSSWKDFVNVSWAERNHMLKHRVNLLLLCEAKLSKLTVSTSEKVSLVAQSEWMVPACTNFYYRFWKQIFD